MAVGRKRKHAVESGNNNNMGTGKHVKLDDDNDSDEVDTSSQASSDFNSRESGEVSSESPDPSRQARNAWQSDTDSPRKDYAPEKDSSFEEGCDSDHRSDSSDSNKEDSSSASESDDEDDKAGDVEVSDAASTGQPPQRNQTNGKPKKKPVVFVPKPAPRLNKYGDLVCERCTNTGHSDDGCPLLWQTYIPGNNDVKKIPRNEMVVCCYNCGVSSRTVGYAKAHWGDDCPELPSFLRDNPSGVWSAAYADTFVVGAEETGGKWRMGGGGEDFDGRRAALYMDRD